MCLFLLVDFETHEGRAMWDLSRDTDIWPSLTHGKV